MKVQLKVISGSKSGQLITINCPQFLIGRADDCHLKPRSELISRYHCAILSEEGYVAIRDLGSKNGVFHNGHKVTLEEELKNGDTLHIGPLEFEIILSVGIKGDMKPKVTSVDDVVDRITKPKEGVETKKNEAAQASSSSSVSSSLENGDSGDISDWLMGEGDGAGGDETVSYDMIQHKEEYKDLIYAVADEGNENKEEAPAEDKKPAIKKDNPTSSDAAANLLKNFFKGSR